MHLARGATHACYWHYHGFYAVRHLSLHLRGVAGLRNGSKGGWLSGHRVLNLHTRRADPNFLHLYAFDGS
jgi:hypothetical protein